MTIANRARLGLARCTEKARRAEARADAALTPQGRQDWSELAAGYQHNADEWRRLLDDMDELTELGCEECGAPEDHDCEPDCECGSCDAERALDDGADAYFDYARD